MPCLPYCLETSFPNCTATNTATSRMSFGDSDWDIGGILFLPLVTVVATPSADVMPVISGPPPCPPFPSSPWQATQMCANTCDPLFGSASWAETWTALAIVDAGGSCGPSVPSSENRYTLSPDGVPPNMFPAE